MALCGGLVLSNTAVAGPFDQVAGDWQGQAAFRASLGGADDAEAYGCCASLGAHLQGLPNARHCRWSQPGRSQTDVPQQRTTLRCEVSVGASGCAVGLGQCSEALR